MFFAREIDDVETVAVAQRSDTEKKGVARFFHLAFVSHRARRVEHENDVLVDQLAFGDIVFRRNLEQEITVLARLAVSQQRHSEIVIREPVKKLKIVVVARSFKRNQS